jgi:hypothetical protein
MFSAANSPVSPLDRSRLLTARSKAGDHRRGTSNQWPNIFGPGADPAAYCYRWLTTLEQMLAEYQQKPSRWTPVVTVPPRLPDG